MDRDCQPGGAGYGAASAIAAITAISRFGEPLGHDDLPLQQIAAFVHGENDRAASAGGRAAGGSCMCDANHSVDDGEVARVGVAADDRRFGRRMREIVLRQHIVRRQGAPRAASGGGFGAGGGAGLRLDLGGRRRAASSRPTGVARRA